jgi:hypothetical protein
MPDAKTLVQLRDRRVVPEHNGYEVEREPLVQKHDSDS